MPDADSLTKRPLESYWGPGVLPLFSGSAFFLLGTSALLKRYLPETPLMQQGLSWLAILLTAAAFAAAAIWGSRSRSGAVVLPRRSDVESGGRMWLLMPMLLVPVVLATLVITYAFTSYGRPPAAVFHDTDRLVVPGFAVLFGVIVLYEARTRKMSLLLAFGIYLICLAPLIWWLPMSPAERFGLLEAAAGGPQAVFGAMRLRSFLKGNPGPVEG